MRYGWSESKGARALLGMLAAAALGAIVAPPAAEAGRSCESMGERWYPSNQGASCDANCDEPCIVKWDCDGEPCEPHHCWKCAAGAPAPPPPSPPPPGPGDADGVRCDAMGEGWYFANQGNACNANCTEPCIPKWDCGGQPCRPHHCWKCAAGAPPQGPGPGDPGDSGGSGTRRIPGALTHTAYSADEQFVRLQYHVEAIESNERVEVELSVETEDGQVIDSAAAANAHQVDVSVQVPIDDVIQPESDADAQALGIPIPTPIPPDRLAKVIKGIVKLPRKPPFHWVLPFPVGNYSKVEACARFVSFDNGTCRYSAPVVSCGKDKCIPSAPKIEGKSSAAECKAFAKVQARSIRIGGPWVLGHTFCTSPSITAVDGCSACNKPADH